ncbi:hypothetical protein [Verrucomicrobium spinosum]|uniref:hypothetical protein n=1 Tax=Verrucomicrobium spinosum TaxID=2736 RepID=UPI000A9AA75B|nr:hypothetical protein [Verrucomicrobium spinosum]
MTTSLTTQPAVTPPASASSTDPAGRPATCHSAILESLREGGRGRVFRDHLRRSLAQQQGSGTSPLTPDDIQIETIGVTLVDAILYDLATRHELGQLLASCDDLTLGEMTETLELMALVACVRPNRLPHSQQPSQTLGGGCMMTGSIILTLQTAKLLQDSGMQPWRHVGKHSAAR